MWRVPVTEWPEPQAVIGSYLHQYAYPDWFNAHQARGKVLETVVAPVEGIVLYVRPIPSMLKGETVAAIGVVGTP